MKIIDDLRCRLGFHKMEAVMGDRDLRKMECKNCGELKWEYRDPTKR